MCGTPSFGKETESEKIVNWKELIGIKICKNNTVRKKENAILEEKERVAFWVKFFSERSAAIEIQSYGS